MITPARPENPVGVTLRALDSHDTLPRLKERSSCLSAGRDLMAKSSQQDKPKRSSVSHKLDGYSSYKGKELANLFLEADTASTASPSSSTSDSGDELDSDSSSACSSHSSGLRDQRPRDRAMKVASWFKSGIDRYRVEKVESWFKSNIDVNGTGAVKMRAFMTTVRGNTEFQAFLCDTAGVAFDAAERRAHAKLNEVGHLALSVDERSGVLLEDKRRTRELFRKITGVDGTDIVLDLPTFVGFFRARGLILE